MLRTMGGLVVLFFGLNGFAQCGEPSTEGFDEGFEEGAQLRAHQDWFYEAENEGPTSQAEIGVASSRGLTNGERAFTWLKHDFDWSDEELKAVIVGGDWQTDENGILDDDRAGWSISNQDDSSDNIFGVQLDPQSDDGEPTMNIETYWDGDLLGDDGGRKSIVSLDKLEPNTWYRLRAKFTKLTDTSAKIEVRFVQLDAQGEETGEAVEGVLEDTAELSGDAGEARPNEVYFNTSPVWPVYKNFTSNVGGFDNAYFELVTE